MFSKNLEIQFFSERTTTRERRPSLIFAAFKRTRLFSAVFMKIYFIRNGHFDGVLSFSIFFFLNGRVFSSQGAEKIVSREIIRRKYYGERNYGSLAKITIHSDILTRPVSASSQLEDCTSRIRRLLQTSFTSARARLFKMHAAPPHTPSRVPARRPVICFVGTRAAL